eukprot:scaffold12965_cov241-Isochrysis_galbana.AAC.5
MRAAPAAPQLPTPGPSAQCTSPAYVCRRCGGPRAAAGWRSALCTVRQASWALLPLRHAAVGADAAAAPTWASPVPWRPVTDKRQVAARASGQKRDNRSSLSS